MEIIKKIFLFFAIIMFTSCDQFYQLANDAFFSDSIGMYEGFIDLSKFLKEGEGPLSQSSKIRLSFNTFSNQFSKKQFLLVNFEGKSVKVPRTLLFDAKSNRLIKEFPYLISFAGISNNSPEYHYFNKLNKEYFLVKDKEVEHFQEDVFKAKFPNTYQIFQLENFVSLTQNMETTDMGKQKKVEFIYTVNNQGYFFPIYYRNYSDNLFSDGDPWIPLLSVEGQYCSPNALLFNGEQDHFYFTVEGVSSDISEFQIYNQNYALLDNRRMLPRLEGGHLVAGTPDISFSKSYTFADKADYLQFRKDISKSNDLYAMHKLYHFAYTIHESKPELTPSLTQVLNMIQYYSLHFFKQPTIDEFFQNQVQNTVSDSSFSLYRYKNKNYLIYLGATNFENEALEQSIQKQFSLFIFDLSNNDLQQIFAPYLKNKTFNNHNIQMNLYDSISSVASIFETECNNEFDQFNQNPIDNIEFPLSYEEDFKNYPQLKFHTFSSSYSSNDTVDRRSSFQITKDFLIYRGSDSPIYQEDIKTLSPSTNDSSFQVLLYIPFSYFIDKPSSPNPTFLGDVNPSEKKDNFFFYNQNSNQSIVGNILFFTDSSNPRFIYKRTFQ